MTIDLKSVAGKIYVDDRADPVDRSKPAGDRTDRESKIHHSELPANTRVIHPDSMVTMDYNPNRWNLHVDESNKITKVEQG